MKEIGNLIDTLAVIPYYFSLGVEIIFMKLNESSEHVSNASEKVAFLAGFCDVLWSLPVANKVPTSLAQSFGKV